MDDFASGRSICQQVSLVSHGNEGGAVKDGDAPQLEGLTSSLQICAAGGLRSAELDPEIGHFARRNGVGYDRYKANVIGSTWIPVEVLSRSGLSERELLLAQVAARNGKVAWIDARARRHATRKHHGEPEWDCELHTISTPERGKWSQEMP
jgi:hypothetical protein